MLRIHPYSIEKDVENYKIVISKEYGKVNKMFKNNGFGDAIEENIKHFIERFSKNYKIDFRQKLSNIKDDWLAIENDVKERMETIFKVGLDYSLDAYLTTNDLASYSYKDGRFFVFVLADNYNYYIIHELFHFYTNEKFKIKLVKLPEASRYIVSESMTEILNLEFLDLIGKLELGKPGHESYRIVVSDAWKKTKDIEQVFDTLYGAVLKGLGTSNL